MLGSKRMHIGITIGEAMECGLLLGYGWGVALAAALLYVVIGMGLLVIATGLMAGLSFAIGGIKLWQINRRTREELTGLTEEVL